LRVNLQAEFRPPEFSNQGVCCPDLYAMLEQNWYKRDHSNLSEIETTSLIQQSLYHPSFFVKSGFGAEPAYPPSVGRAVLPDKEDDLTKGIGSCYRAL
jgi:hypothetical protein